MEIGIISKIEALKLNQKWYFTGIICKNGHIDKRYVNTGICYGCKRDINKRNILNNPQTFKEISKRTYNKNKDKHTVYSRIWASKNRERSNATKKRYKENHREKCLAKARAYSKRIRKDPFIRLSKNMSKAIWECLKNNKNRLSWLKFVDYNLEDLKTHLESKFDTNMTWENYGSYWHIDHKRPLSWFNLETEFKEAWSLSNLQPLEASKNYSKCNRYEG